MVNTNIEGIVDFFETLAERGIVKLTSDETHFREIADLMRTVKNEGRFHTRLRELSTHYRDAARDLNQGFPYSDSRSIGERMQAVVDMGPEVEAVELCGTVSGAISYVGVIFSP